MESLQSTARLVALVKRISAAQGHSTTPSNQLINQSGVPGFETLSRYISIWRPKPIHKRRSRSLIQSPPLIIFCSGRGAAPKNIAKYTEKYKYLYPEAEILLIESPTSSTVQVNLGTAIEVVKRHIELHKVVNTKGIVIHVASNGGAYTATRLVREIARAKVGQVPLEAMVLDCSPGKYSTSQSLRSAKRNLLPKNIILRILGSWAVYAFYGINIIVKVMLPLPDKATKTARSLNNPDLFPTKDTKRLYLYSKADGWIGHEQIGKHADDAEALGYSVRKEVFQKAGHCSLTMEDGWRYWRAVQGVVEDEKEGRQASEISDESADVRVTMPVLERRASDGDGYFIESGVVDEGHFVERSYEFMDREEEEHFEEPKPDFASLYETNDDGDPSWLDV
ncbi:Transmembrane protein [Pseudocercospora fuligena]|uniref:Transmembrane protein n=1 Tax=Pseudocercospora fuligena TaxID=685502 RepID=A0A8H6RJF3_9PEZI|nr:Transmembrane protein [Pseudocercospora fuligena]